MTSPAVGYDVVSDPQDPAVIASQQVVADLERALDETDFSALAQEHRESLQSIALDPRVQEVTMPLDIPADWTFKNASVARNFDRHVREQLPWYDMATGIVAHFGRHYLPEGGRMYDLGASTGNITKMLENEIQGRNVDAISVDNSEQMAECWQGIGAFSVDDVRTMDYQPYDFGVCFLLLMFLPPAQQKQTVLRLYDHLNPGGCLVIFDKTDPFDGYLGTVAHRLTMAGKVATGVDPEEIIKKELSLAGAQRPVDPKTLGLDKLGAKEVFRFGEFAGWVVTK